MSDQGDAALGMYHSSPLTEAEVIGIRDNAECIAMPASVATEV